MLYLFKRFKRIKEIIRIRTKSEEDKMARIRTVKPEFFKHEEIYQAEIEEKLPLRLAFIGLFGVC